jgi:hypothetical protein
VSLSSQDCVTLLAGSSQMTAFISASNKSTNNKIAPSGKLKLSKCGVIIAYSTGDKQQLY